MNRAFKLSVIEVYENLAKIEEICRSISFFFSKIYDMESDFSKTSRLANLSKQVVFLAIQRSKTLSSEVGNKLCLLEEHGICITGDAGMLMESVVSSVTNIENRYNQGDYEGIIKDLESIGSKCLEIKEALRTGVEI
jgi:hypothetical protein